MSASSNPLARAGLLLAALALAVSAPAFVIFWKVYEVPLRWAPGNAPLRIMLGDSPTLSDGTTYNTSAQAAAQAWNSKLGSIAFTTAFASLGEIGERNGVSEVYFSTTLYGREFPNAVALTASLSSTNPNKESDIIFNSKYRFDSYRGPQRSANGEWIFDLYRVMLHELGHSVGLDHPNEAGQSAPSVMNVPADKNADSLTEDDIAGGQALYGAPGAAPAANDNFANAIELFLAASNAFSVTVQNFNCTREPNEPRQAGSAGGRSIWFKWTAPGNGGATLDTLGSYCDTLLAVYTGTALANLVTVASNDDIGQFTNRLSKLTFYARQGTTYYLAVDGHEGDAGRIMLNMLVDPNATPPPEITTQPASATVNAGERATFSVTATGTGTLTYQWLFNGSAIAGATAATYEIASAATTHAGDYSVQVANAAGGATSNRAKLTVQIPPPTISTQPANLSLTSGGRGTLSVTATGTGSLTYQWRLNGAAIAGATSSSYEITNASLTDAGTYTVVVTASGVSTTSNAATVSVTAPVPTPTPSSSGGGGGGGAPSLWFAGALAAAGLSRWLWPRNLRPDGRR